MEAAIATNKAAKAQGKINLQYYDLEVNSLRMPMSDEEFETFCHQNPNLKIEQDKHGNIIIMSSVSLLSGNHENEVNIDLGVWNRQHKLGRTFSPSTLFILPDGEKRMADASFVSQQRLRQLPASEWKKFAHVAPDFVVEVRSPSDSIEALKSKMTNVWLANGVRLAWLLDPENETAIVFRPDNEPVEIQGFDQVLSGGEVLPGFEFDLSILKEQ